MMVDREGMITGRGGMEDDEEGEREGRGER